MKSVFCVTWIVVFIGLTVVPPIVAQANENAVTVDPSAIEIHAVKDHSSASATFYVTPNEQLDDITLYASDLVDTKGLPTTQPKLLANQVTFSPSSIDNPLIGRRHQLQVNVNNITQAGTWAGEITLQWTGTVTGAMSIPLTVSMETVPTLVIESPNSVIVRGTRGSMTTSRRVTLHEAAGGSPVTGLTLFPHELLNEDQSEVLPSTAISATLETTGGKQQPTQIPSDGRADVVITLDLDGVRSDHYEGELILQSDNAADVFIPIKVDVKDPSGWAWLALGVGVILGVGLTIYRSSVLPKEKVHARIEVLREHQASDPAFKQYCGPQNVDREIRVASNYLRQNRPDDAAKALDEAEEVWDHWSRFRESLLGSIELINHIIATIDGTEDDFKLLSCIAALRDEILIVRDEQIPEYVDKAHDLRGKIKDKDTGWLILIDRTLAFHKNLEAMQENLRKAGQSDEVAFDVVELYELHTRLDGIKSNFETITSAPTKEILDPLSQQLEELQTDLEAASERGTKAKAGYQGFSVQSLSWFEEIEMEEEHILAAVRFVEDRLRDAEALTKKKHWISACSLAENCWRAARACVFLSISAEDYRQGQTDEKWASVVQAEQTLSDWLVSSHYDKPVQDFFDALSPLAENLKKAVDHMSDIPFPLDWTSPPTVSGKGFERVVPIELAELAKTGGIDVTYSPTGRSAKAARLHPLNREWWTPRRRLLAAEIVTFVIGVGLLTIAGYKELYADMHTFGVNGGWDYFKLFVWGFGAEAGRSQIVGLVKDWGILTPREN